MLTPGSGPNDAVQLEHYTEVALNAGADTTDDLDALLDELEDEKANLEFQQQQAAALAEQIAASQKAAEEAAAEYTQRKAQAEAELGQLLAEEEQRRQEDAARAAQEAFERAQAEAEAEANNGGGSSGGGSTGGGSGGGSNGGVRRWVRRRHADRWRWRRWHTPGVQPGRHRGRSSPQPVGRALQVRRRTARCRVRLLGSHQVRLGSGGRLPAAPEPCPVRLDTAGVDRSAQPVT